MVDPKQVDYSELFELSEPDNNRYMRLTLRTIGL